MKILFLNVMAALAISSFSFAPNTNKNNAELKEKEQTFLQQQKYNRQVEGTDGAGGGSGSSGRHYYDNRDSGDDSSYHAQEIGFDDKVTLRGTLRTYEWYECIGNFFGGNITTQMDEDWFKLPLKRTHNYIFNFDLQYHIPGYHCEISKYRGDYDPSEVICRVNDGLPIEIELNPGTYYFRIYADEKDQILKDNKYQLKIDASDPEEHDVQLYPENGKEGVALWESDLKPDQVNRWGRPSQDLWSIQVTGGPYNPYNDDYNRGYWDPLYQLDDVYLDSVVYLWGKNNLDTLHEILSITTDRVDDAMKAQAQNEYETVLYEQYFWLACDGGCYLLDCGTTMSSVSGSTSKFAKVLDKIATVVGLFSDVYSVCTDVANLIMLRPDSLDRAYLSAFLGGLKASANLKGVEYINRCLCIPRYAYVEYYNDGAVINHSGYTWKTTHAVRDTAYCEDYIFDKDFISNWQSIHIGSEDKSYHGKVSTFDSINSLNDYTNNSALMLADQYNEAVQQAIADYNTEHPEEQNNSNNQDETIITPEITRFSINNCANFEKNKFLIGFDYNDPNNELTDFKFNLSSSEGSKTYNLNKANKSVYITGDDVFDFSSGLEYTYSFTYHYNNEQVTYTSGRISFIEGTEYENHFGDHNEDVHSHADDIFQPYIPPYIGGNEPWIHDGGGIGGGFEIPDKPWIGGGIGGGGFGGGLGGGGN